MGWKISDLQGASLPLTGNELLEVTQGENSRSVRVADLLPGFENSLGADLADADDETKGAALIGYAGSTVAAVLAELEEASSQYVTPDQFGGVGTVGGNTDCTAGLIAALATGLPVKGRHGMKYGITGNVTLPAVTRLSEIKLKQLSPNSASRRTLYQNNGTLCHLYRVEVDRNGNGLGGQVSNSAAVYISNCADARALYCDVTGNDYGDGITFTDSKIFVANNKIHDMSFGTSSSAVATDDQMQGLFISRCSGVVAFNEVSNLRGQWIGQALINRFTRGFAYAGCYDLLTIGNKIDGVDQAFDYSGDQNNRRTKSIGNVASNCYTWGFKSANTHTDSTFTNDIAYRCGLGGFVASAPNATIDGITSDKLTQNITYTNCLDIECGSSGVWSGNPSLQGGFQALNSAAYPDFPRGIKWIGCRSTGGTAHYGFRNTVTVPATGAFWNEAINCECFGAVTANFAGMNQGVTTKTTPASNGTSGSWTDMTWSAVSVDRMNGNYSASEIIIRRSGLYAVTLGITQAGHATGDRGVRMLLNASVVPGSNVKIPAVNTDDKSVITTAYVPCNAGDILKGQVFQNSGGTLSATSGSFSAVLISPGQGRT